VSPRGDGADAIELLLRAATVALLPRAGEAASARLEAELLLIHALGAGGRERLITLRSVPPEVEERFRDALAERLQTGRPVAYMIGHREFLEFDLLVDERVLVPRPETETVADVLDALLEGGTLPAGPVVDRGTGSGNLALAVRGRRPVLALDLSAGALEVARANLTRCGPEFPVQLVQADGLAALLPASVAVVLANPPYIEPAELDGLPEDVRRHEPTAALVPGEGSVPAMFARLLAESRAALLPGGCLITEVGQGQAAAVAEQAAELGFERVEITEDLAGVPRVIAAWASSRPGAERRA
jgi:release factor glutamine methyltransferase